MASAPVNTPSASLLTSAARIAPWSSPLGSLLRSAEKIAAAEALAAEKAAAEEREKSQRESAMAAFKIQKGIAIAIATINAIQAVS
jgi:hypothetical protein